MSVTTMPPTLTTALSLVDAGISVVPVRTDGTKRPDLPTWTTHQTHRAVDTDVIGWFALTPDRGIGVITGHVSGNLEMFEIEGRALDQLTEIEDLLEGSGLGTLWATVNNGWTEVSPSGGIHWFYRLDSPVPGNTKVAQRSREHGGLTLAETRGEGGFVVTAPTPGTAHETGRPWEIRTGGPTTIPTITRDERDQLLAVFGIILDERAPAPAEVAQIWNETGTASSGTRPGDEFEARTDWAEILTPHGWTLVYQRGRERYWRRPGKTIGLSATTGAREDRDRLYVFSSSTDFPSEESITKFRAHAILNHGGDNTAAARAIAAKRPKPERHLAAVPTVDGNTALKPNPATGPRPDTMTDDGNATLFAHQHGHEVRFVARRGEWLVWDGHRWQFDHAAHVMELAKNTVRSIDTGDDQGFKHRQRSLSRRSIESMLVLARSIPGIVVQPDDLDAHPMLLNTPNGAVDLTTGTLTAPNRDELHTRSTPVAPTRMPTPRWDRFLEQTFHGHAEIPGFVQRLAGYSATGAVTRHVLPFLHGSGGNGKSVFLEVLRAVLGDYAATTPAKFLMAGVNQHETEIARLSGLRLVISSEVNEQDKFDEAKVKLLTGGDALTARFMHQNHFTFTPTHTLWLMGNHQPRVQAGGESFWRRLRLVPFTNTVSDADKVDGLEHLIVEEEAPGILQWVIDGAVAYAAEGLTAPASVMAATEAYASEEDHLAQFIEERLHTSPAGRVATTEVRNAYETWCREQSEQPMSPQSFGRELRTRLGVQVAKSNGRKFYTGVLLYAPEDEEERTLAWNDR